jgi:hypothetical protein
MNRFADAYGRALFPNRYARRSGTTGGARASSGQPAAIPSDGLDLAIGAGVYRLVNAVEALVDVLRQRARPSTAAAQHVPTANPVGCG